MGDFTHCFVLFRTISSKGNGMNQDEALTAEEVAGLLKVSKDTVYSLKDKGELPFFRLGASCVLPKMPCRITSSAINPGTTSRRKKLLEYTRQRTRATSSSAGRTSFLMRCPTT